MEKAEELLELQMQSENAALQLALAHRPLVIVLSAELFDHVPSKPSRSAQ